MAAGLPVVTNCPGEVEETVNAAGAGIAVPPDELERAVRTAAQASPDQLATWGDGGRRFIQRFRSRQVIATQLDTVLNRVVGP